MNASLDHVIVVVPSLAEAIAGFRAAGFVVLPGGRHEGLPTENAQVVFADGAYLELLAAREPDARASLRELRGTGRWERHLHEASALARRFLPSLAGPDGVADWALRATPLDRIAAESRRRGYAMTGPVELGRRRPDGQQLAMRLLFPAERWQPFLIEDRTPMSLRIPADPAVRAHANGARGIARVTVRAGVVVSAAMGYVDHFDARITPRLDGSADVAFGRELLTLREGEPQGACGVTLAGVAELPPGILTLGVKPGG